jgi:hypothetical protein
MLPIGVWRKNSNITFTILDITHLEFCLRLHVEPTQLGPIDGVRPETEIISIY